VSKPNFLKTLVLVLSCLACFGNAQATFDGIWKDVQPGFPGPTINYFVQTYDSGSAVVMATEDLSRISVFLDENYSDGVDVEDLGGAGHHLKVVFFNQEQGHAVLSHGDQILRKSRIFKWFSSPILATHSGLWKDVPPFQEGTLNLYYQRYDTGSGIAVLTSDLSWFQVFLDADVSSGLDAEDLVGSTARLILTFTDHSQGTADWTSSMELQSGGAFPVHRWNAAPGVSVIPPGGMVHGALLVSDNAYADLDTNDPFQQGDNDSISSAQPIGIPASVGGWAYYHNEFDFDEDYYRVHLSGQSLTITLIIARPDLLDLDLHLLDSAGQNLSIPSEGTGKVEQIITGSVSGEVFIRVSPSPRSSELGAGSSNYTLLLGQGLDVGKGFPVPAEAEFVPGEAVVKFRPGWASPAALHAQGYAIEAGDTETRPVLVRMSDLAESPDVQWFTSAAEEVGKKTMEAIYALRERTDVVWAEPNYIRRPVLEPNDPFYTQQWHYPLINLPAAWNYITGSEEVIVAVLDTGILGGHPDFDPTRFVDGLGYDFIRDPVSAADGDGIDPDPTDPGDKGGGGVSSFHGTHVAGTIGAWTDNGVGVSGVDQRCTLMILRVLGTAGGTDYDIGQAVLYAAGLPNDSQTVPEQRADVINMSLGGPGGSSLLAYVVQEARAQGIVVAAAAGNESGNAENFVPGALPGVVTVSAVDLNKQLAWYSNFGSVVDVAAPGGNKAVDLDGDGFPDAVLSTLGDDSMSGSVRYTYGRYQGTSMSTAHVSGVIALMQAAYMSANNGQRFSPEEFDAWLASGVLTQDLGVPGRDDLYGYGLMDAKLAVEHALGTDSTTSPKIGVSPSSLNFDRNTIQLLLTVLNVGGTYPSSTFPFQVSSGLRPWLSVDKTSGVVGSSDPKDAVVTVTVDRTHVEDGTHAAVIVITADWPASGFTQVPVIMTKATDSVMAGDVGPVYLLAIDPVTLMTLGQVTLQAKDSYLFEMNLLQPGTYLVAAGTDRNNNGYIDDEGEAFGYFPLSSLPEPVVVGNAQTTSVSFPINEIFNLPNATTASKGLSVDGADSSWKRIRPERLLELQGLPKGTP